MKKVLAVVVVSLSLSLGACGSWDNSLQRFGNNWSNNPAEVKCYSGGIKILDLKTKGKVTDDPNSDGFYFQNTDGSFTEVAADCIFKYK